MPAREPRRVAAWLSRFFDSLARSSRVFLITVLVACGVEVLVDWNQTLFEINVLRDHIRQKGVNYAGLLNRAAVEPLRARDRTALARLTAGILDDEDAVYVRITDAQRGVVFEEMDEPYEADRMRLGRGAFRVQYAQLMERDLRGVTENLEGFKRRLANSRYRDFPQLWTDAMNRIIVRFVPPPPQPAARAGIVYQDRLRDEHRQRDDRITWALARIETDGQLVGAVLVAFDMTRTNAAVRMKFLKGLGMVLFFVALILVQNVLSRRDKLRLLDIERRYAHAKEVLRAALPRTAIEVPELGLTIRGALEQARGAVDGLVWDARVEAGATTLLLVDPDGDGIDAAAIALHILRVFRGRGASTNKESDAASATDPEHGLLEEFAALGAATHDIPLTRPIGVLLLRVVAGGRFAGLASRIAALHIVPGEGASLARVPLQTQEGAVPDGIVGPITTFGGELASGSALLCACAGKGRRDALIDGESLARYILRTRARAAPGADSPPGSPLAVEDAAIWARGKNSALIDNDIAVITIQRAQA